MCSADCVITLALVVSLFRLGKKYLESLGLDESDRLLPKSNDLGFHGALNCTSLTVIITLH